MGMTREEAISWLKKMKVKYIHGGDEEFDAKRKEALGMAIAALREQCVREATKTSGETVTNSHQFETVTNCHGLTNADHIRSMTDEELAEFLHDAMLPHAYWMDWLKQPYGGDT